MDLNKQQIDELEAALERLNQLDPALLPDPAADLAELLGRILDNLETD